MHRGLVGEGRGEDQAQPDQGGREPFLQPVPPYPGTDPLELPRHALAIIDRRSHPLPPFEALAGVLLDPLAQRGRLLPEPTPAKRRVGKTWGRTYRYPGSPYH